MPIHSSSAPTAWVAAALAAMLTSLTAPPAGAHADVHDAIPDAPGGQAGLALAVSQLSAKRALPSQGLPGYLLLGDPGMDRRGLKLEHGVAQLGYRFTNALGAELALGAHGSDPPHVEAAWVQGRGSADAADWTLGAGRNTPSLGPVMTNAGHLDRFGAMPLAKHAVTNGDWIDDGAEWGLRGRAGGIEGALDLGLWAGRTFPGSRAGSATPAVHLGVQWDGGAGGVQLDAFWAQLKPTGRGSRIDNTNGGHTHVAPRCDAALAEVVCFDGRARIAGLSAQWEPHDGPVTLTAAVMWRHEDGTLQSRNGLGDHAGRHRGAWLQGLWRASADWDAALRHERLMARQSLHGSGATLLAAEAGLGAYAPQRRTTAMVGAALAPWADLRFEAGRETAGANAANFVALRLIVQWEGAFGGP
jgi:hypothetical protein